MLTAILIYLFISCCIGIGLEIYSLIEDSKHPIISKWLVGSWVDIFARLIVAFFLGPILVPILLVDLIKS